jgi:hypothetical protein
VIWAVSLLSAELSSRVLTPATTLWYSEFEKIVRVNPKTIYSVLYPHKGYFAGLAQKLFRGEPAIPKLD